MENKRIKFITESSEKIENRQLVYSLEEFSFDTEPKVFSVDLSLILNNLNLTIVDGKVVQIWGYCGNATWEKISSHEPNYIKGILKVEHSLKLGLSYGIYDNDVPVYFNEQSGWVCLGNKDSLAEAIEFIPNCVAVINKENLEALWLKPKWEP